MTQGRIPYLPIVVAFCLAAILGYAVFSAWVVFYSDDASLKGDVIGTWKSFAVLAFGFWLGSSSGGKSQSTTPTGTPDDPLAVEGATTPAKPVSVQEKGKKP